MVEGAGFEPAKAEPADLQSAPVDRLGTPPRCEPRIVRPVQGCVNSQLGEIQGFLTGFLHCNVSEWLSPILASVWVDFGWAKPAIPCRDAANQRGYSRNQHSDGRAPLRG